VKRNRHPDSFPNGYIGLAGAFRRFVLKKFPELNPDDAFKSACDFQEVEDRFGKAEMMFRKFISDKHIFPFKYTPETGLLTLSPDEWKGESARHGFWSNYVDGPTVFAPLVPGPDTMVSGRLAPVCFDQKAFEKWLSAQLSNGRKGRPPPH